MQKIVSLIIVTMSIAGCVAGSQATKVKNVASIETGCQTYQIADQRSDSGGTHYVLKGCGQRIVYHCTHPKFGAYGAEDTCIKK